MVGVLTRMNFAVLRNTVNGNKMAWIAVGGSVGICLAIANIVLAFFDFTHPRMLMDLLAVTFGLWALGWLVGPTFAGEPPLSGEHFRRQPIPRRTLAMGLFASALMAVTTAVTFVAFCALIVFAARLSLMAVVVSIPAVVLMVLLVVLLSRVASLLFTAVARSRFGGVITATVTAAMIALASFSWVVFIGIYLVLEYGFPPNVSTALRSLPSSWGLLSVEAAGRGDWLWTVGPLLALAALVVVLFFVWTWLLGPQRIARAVIRGSVAERAAPSGWYARSDMGVLYLKEMRTWWRDPLRTQNIALPAAFAIITALFPLMLDSTHFFPFIGAATALMGASTCGNLYGQDGTALWMTLQLPGKERADVRARQLAWLTVFGPLSLVLTVVGSIIHGDINLVPWALTGTFAALGCGVGLLIWVSVVGLVPGPDPHKSKNSPLDHGDVTGQAFLMLFLTAVASGPALGVAFAGHTLDQPALLWASVPVALVSGIVCYVRLGAVAARRLREKGPELLQLMRTGPTAAEEVEGEEMPSPFETMGAKGHCVMWGCMFLGIMGLFPQGLVPLGIKLTGAEDKVWFLALYMPEPWQWPVVAAMILVGLCGFGGAYGVYRAEGRRLAAVAREARLSQAASQSADAEQSSDADRLSTV